MNFSPVNTSSAHSSSDPMSNDVKSQEASPYLYCVSQFIDEELTESRSREAYVFASESATFQELNGEKSLVFVSNFPIQDPRVAKAMATDDHGVYFMLNTKSWSSARGELDHQNIGLSITITPRQLRDHDKSTPMHVPFSVSYHATAANSKLEIRFAKKDRTTVISGITITIPYSVYKNIGTQFSKMGVPDDHNRFLLD
jgi:hypothetical protein